MGLLALFFLERFFAFHHHEAPADPDDPCPTHPHEHAGGRGHSAGVVDAEAPGGGESPTKGTSLHWGAAAFGLAMHSLAGGVALASASAANAEVRHGLGAAAWGVFVATLVHKPADALTIVSLMLRAGVPRPLAHLVNLAFALMIPGGVVLFFLGVDRLGPTAAASLTAAALAFSAGTFLCIALSDLLPELQFHAHDRLKLSAALLGGLLLMGAATLLGSARGARAGPGGTEGRAGEGSARAGLADLGIHGEPRLPKEISWLSGDDPNRREVEVDLIASFLEDRIAWTATPRRSRPGADSPGWALAVLGTFATAQLARSAAPDIVVLRAQRGPDGRPVELKAPDGGATALVFYSPECPISNAYSPTLNRLAADFPAERVRFVAVCVDPDLSDADVAAHAKDFGLKFPVVRDRNGSLAAKLGATVTPEAFVLDAAGRVRYHGRIDDQFAAPAEAERQPGHARASRRRRRRARRPGRGGYATSRRSAARSPSPRSRPRRRPTRRTSPRILQKNCQECHRKGQVGPFALETYEQARKRADDIATWPRTARCRRGSRRRESGRSSSTTARSRRPISPRWPPGPTPAHPWATPPTCPRRRASPTTGSLGTPDLVIEPAEDFAIPADGPDIYRCFVIPTNLPKDMYISAIEYRPGNRRVVHHMLAYVDVSGEGRKRDAA